MFFKKKKIIFLDIDGVLNISESIVEHNNKYFSDMDEDKINYLNNICKKFNIKIVLSSSWRDNNSIEDTNDFFKYKGIKNKIVDYVEQFKDKNEAIREYIEKNNIKDFIVIDDEDKVLKGFDSSNILKTTDGINENKYQELLRKLK